MGAVVSGVWINAAPWYRLITGSIADSGKAVPLAAGPAS